MEHKKEEMKLQDQVKVGLWRHHPLPLFLGTPSPSSANAILECSLPVAPDRSHPLVNGASDVGVAAPCKKVRR